MKHLGLRSIVLIAVFAAGLATGGAGPALAQDCATAPESSAEMRGQLAELLGAIAQLEGGLSGDLSEYPAEEIARGEDALAQMRAFVPAVQACIAEREAAERAGPRESERPQLIPIDTGPGPDMPIPCVLRDLICTDLQGNPTGGGTERGPQGPPPVPEPAVAATCEGGFTRAELQEMIGQGQSTIAALERSRGQVGGPGGDPQIDARIREIRDQIAAAQAALASCGAR